MSAKSSPNSIVFYAILAFVLACFLIDNPELLTHTNITALSTVVIAVFTVYLSLETQLLRKDQAEQIKLAQELAIRPIISFDLFRSDTNLILEISNSGAGPAFDIEFDFPLGNKDVFTNANMISDGITLLGVGQKRNAILSRLIDLEGSGYQNVIFVKYFSETGREYNLDFRVDFVEFNRGEGCLIPRLQRQN